MSAEPVASSAAGVDRPGYARLSRRLRAYLIDVIIFLVAMVAALIAASVVRSDGFSRALGFAVVIGVLAYEPWLVALTGGSVGHYLTNLRVVERERGKDITARRARAAKNPTARARR